MTEFRALKPVIEYRSNPLGMDDTRPRFSWRLASDRQETVQVACRLQVAASADGFDAPVWDSGRRESDQSLFVHYEGPQPGSRQRLYWRVKAWDNHGRESGWSSPAWWETGLSTDDWQARWITYPWQEDPKVSNPSPVFRKEFTLTGVVAAARLYITSLGLYEVLLNGRRVGDLLFTPGWTAYDKRLQYQVYDVTDQVAGVENVIAVTLGDGWYRGRLMNTTGNVWGDRLALLAQLEITCEDGTREVIVSDADWKTATGPVLSSDIYDGERYDSRLEAPVSDDGGWRNAVEFTGEVPTLVAGSASVVRATEVLAPVSIKRQSNGTHIVDFGQNMVGRVRLKVKGEAGNIVTLRHAEVVGPDGALYTDNLRSAKQTVEYVLNGEAQALEPHFTFQGFRYVAVTGYPGELTHDNIQGIVIHSDMARAGRFESSNPRLNRLQNNIDWSLRGNFLDVPTDCPQRDERLGWTGDAQVFAQTAAYNRHTAEFFKKWLADLALEQTPEGAIPYVAPDAIGAAGFMESPKFKLLRSIMGLLVGEMTDGATGWGDAATIMPMTLYHHYGDRDFLEHNFATMQRWVDFLAGLAAKRRRVWAVPSKWLDREKSDDENYILRGYMTFGDWLAPGCGFSFLPLGCVPATYVNTVFLAHSSSLVADAAEVLGKASAARRYRELSNRVRLAFQREYLAGERLVEDTQGALVLALAFDMVPEAAAPSLAARLNQLVIEAGHTIGTGFLATPHVLAVLTRYGYLDTAYRLLLSGEYPSWLYTVDHGATTMWERWNSIEPDGAFGNKGMNSFNHYAYGSVGAWFYETIAGIKALEPGFKRFRIAPRPGGGLDHAHASVETGYGTIRSEWNRSDRGYTLTVEAPVNTRAEVVLPDDPHTTHTLGSGEHVFSWR